MPKDFKGVMHEYGEGGLHSGSKTGPKVTNPKQAVAIAFSEDRHMKMAAHHALGLAHHLTKMRKKGKVKG